MYPTLETICGALQKYSIPSTLVGEQGSNLSFTTAPLSYTLQIVGHKTEPIILVMKSQENASNVFSIGNVDNLAELCSWICEYQEEKRRELVRGQLRPAPQSDTALLELLRSDAADPLNIFTTVQTMLEWGHLLNMVVALFTPFGLQPTFASANSVVFGVEHLTTDKNRVGPRIDRFRKDKLKKDGVDDGILGDLNLSTCVTLLHVRAHSAAESAADRKRLLSTMLMEAGYIGEQEDEDLIPQKVLLYDLSKAGDRIALVERILLMQASERKLRVPFENKKRKGEQESRFAGIKGAPSPEQRPVAYAYHRKAERGRGSVLKREIREHNVDPVVEERSVERSPMPPAGCENLREYVLLKAQEKVSEESQREHGRGQEVCGEVVPGLTFEESEETYGPITPSASLPRYSGKNCVEVEKDEVGADSLYAGTLLEVGCWDNYEFVYAFSRLLPVSLHIVLSEFLC